MKLAKRSKSYEPQVVLVYKEKPSSPDDIYALIYVYNPSSEPYVMSTEAGFFQTVDQETGEGIKTGPKPTELMLKPNQMAKAGEILWWELDGSVGFTLKFRKQGQKKWSVCDYNLKSCEGTKRVFSQIKKEGRICIPLALRKE